MRNTLFALLFILANSVWAQEDEQSRSSMIVNRVNVIAAEVVINDSYYKIDTNMRVYDKNGSLLSKSRLKKGQEVAFELSPYKAGQHKQIKSITILGD